MVHLFPDHISKEALMENAATIRGETNLVQRAKEGDVNAFEQLYRKNVGRVYALCLRLSSDTSRAEELTQDVFVRIWEKLKTFKGQSAFSSWLHRVAVNVVIDHQRAAGRIAAKETAVTAAAPSDMVQPAYPPDGRIDLERAIRRLPDGARLVFVLHDVEGYQHREIAEATGLAVGTSKAQLFRARRLLREALQR